MSSRSASSRASRVSEGRPEARRFRASASARGTMRSTRAPPWGLTRSASASAVSVDMLGSPLRSLQVEGEDLIGGAGVQAALRLAAAAPAPGASLLPGTHGARAGPAADAGVAPRVERVHGDVVGSDVGPDLGAGPRDEGIDLDQAEPRVDLHGAGRRPVARLLAADGRDPGVEAAQRLAQGLDLAQVAAVVGGPLPETLAVGCRLLLDALGGPDGPDGEAVPLLEPPPERVGLGEQQAGVEGEDVDGKPVARDQVDDDA